MPEVDGERGEHGKEGAPEVFLEEALLLFVGFLGAEEEDALRSQQWLHLLEKAAVLLVDQLMDARDHRGHRLRRRLAVRARILVAGVDPALQLGHPHHEELVEIRAEDGEKLHALEQRHGGILGLFEHPPIELQPRQFTIDERVWTHITLDR
jgi:hypothetical protein